MRGYCEKVLGQSVVNLARDARAFLRDGAPELGEPDGAPGAYEQDAEGEDTQEVRLRDRSAPQQGREEIVERGKEHQRRAEPEPAVEVVAAVVDAEAVPHDGQQVEQGLCDERSEQQRRDLTGAAGVQRGQGAPE